MGFPGNVFFTATYTLEGNTLRLELAGLPDRRTPISLVQHQYFNLGTGFDVLDHHLTINGSARSEVDGHLIPTGAILPVVIGAGFSGHGFKFTPGIGQVLADLATGVRPEVPGVDLGAFALARFGAGVVAPEPVEV